MDYMAFIRQYLASLVVGILILFALLIPVSADTPPADIVLLNGSVYTVQPGSDWSKTPLQAIAIQGDSILSVGSDEEIQEYVGPDTTVFDLAGRMVLPGFVDSHIHFGASAELTFGVNLSSCHTISEVQEQIATYHADNPDIDVLRGFGWNYFIFNESGPDKTMIDAVVSDKPVILTSFDGHTTWVNSAALEIADVNADTPDPQGGKVDRDAEGNPTGILREMAGAALVTSRVTPLTPEQIESKVKEILPQASEYGVTTADDAALSPEMILAFSHLESEGELPVRIFGEMVAIPDFGVEQVALMEIEQDLFASSPSVKGISDLAVFHQQSDSNEGAGDITSIESYIENLDTQGLFRLQTGKLFLDGVVEGHTGYLLSPYADQPDTRGMVNWDADAFEEMIRSLDREGFQVDIHAIGDGAVRMSLDAYEKAQQKNGVRDSRHKISHIQLINTSDIPRLASLGVVASLQPNWFYYDTNFENTSLPFLGKKRSEEMYSLRTLMDSGAIVAFGTDWPVGTDYLTFNPLDGIRTAVTRLPLPPGSPYSEPYRPKERISLKEAIVAATYAGAYSNFMENSTGSLEMGKLADIIILDQDLFTIPPEDINKARVVATFLEGREVWADPLFLPVS